MMGVSGKPKASQFYLDRAAECRVAAETTLLANVRTKNAHAEASWLAMAEIATLREQGIVRIDGQDYGKPAPEVDDDGPDGPDEAD